MSATMKFNLINLTIVVAISFFLIYVTNHYILTISFYQRNAEIFSGAGESGVVEFAGMQKWIYFFTALYLFVKIAVVSLLLYTALYLNDQHIAYKKVIGIVLTAEYINFIPATLKIFLFHRYYPDGTLAEWHALYPFSALSIVKNAPVNWTYALQSLNVFEVSYWFLLAFGIQRHTDFNFDGSLRIVVLSYLPAFFIWVSAATFCSLLLIPING